MTLCWGKKQLEDSSISNVKVKMFVQGVRTSRRKLQAWVLFLSFWNFVYSAGSSFLNVLGVIYVGKCKVAGLPMNVYGREIYIFPAR